MCLRIKKLRDICGPKRDKETGEWRRLHNGELLGRSCREQPQLFTASSHKHLKGHRLKVSENKEAEGHMWT